MDTHVREAESWNPERSWSTSEALRQDGMRAMRRAASSTNVGHATPGKPPLGGRPSADLELELLGQNNGKPRLKGYIQYYLGEVLEQM